MLINKLPSVSSIFEYRPVIQRTSLHKSNFLRLEPPTPMPMQLEIHKRPICGPVPFPEFSCEEPATCIIEAIPGKEMGLHKNQELNCNPYTFSTIGMPDSDLVREEAIRTIGNLNIRTRTPKGISFRVSKIINQNMPFSTMWFQNKPYKFDSYKGYQNPQSISFKSEVTEVTMFPRKPSLSDRSQHVPFQMNIHPYSWYPNVSPQPVQYYPGVPSRDDRYPNEMYQSVLPSKISTNIWYPLQDGIPEVPYRSDMTSQTLPIPSKTSREVQYSYDVTPRDLLYQSDTSHGVTFLRQLSRDVQYPNYDPPRNVPYNNDMAQTVPFPGEKSRDVEYPHNVPPQGPYQSDMSQTVTFPGQTSREVQYPHEEKSRDVQYQSEMTQAVQYPSEKSRDFQYPHDRPLQYQAYPHGVIAYDNPNFFGKRPGIKRTHSHTKPDIEFRGREESVTPYENPDENLPNGVNRVMRPGETTSTVPPFAIGFVPSTPDSDFYQDICVGHAQCFKYNWKKATTDVQNNQRHRFK